MFRHKKLNPQGWTSVQLLGVSSQWGPFSFVPFDQFVPQILAAWELLLFLNQLIFMGLSQIEYLVSGQVLFSSYLSIIGLDDGGSSLVQSTRWSR